MAKPIRATPTLVGKAAVEFVKQMDARAKGRMSKIDRELNEIRKKNAHLFSS